MADRVERMLSGILTVAAVAIAGVLIHREFIAKPPSAQQAIRDPVYVKNWKDMLSDGQLMGRSDALVHLIEFGDFECPFCARFHKTFHELRNRYGDDVALTYVHYPLSNHVFAKPAAVASECAALQGRFSQFADVLYDQQDSLGKKPWVAFAQEASLADTLAFSRCMADSASTMRVSSGVALGDQLQIRGTPTVLINGWRYPSPPNTAQLAMVIDSLRAGIDPFKGR